jgi:23S rRNA (cytosine1962-C5)-methyltransferase
MKIVTIKPGRSNPFKQRHPWLFSGAIASLTGNPQAGDIVKVCDDKNSFIAYGLYNPHSQIRVRLYSFTEDEVPGAAFWQDKIKQAIYLRENTLGFVPAKDNACRLINSEADGLSGLTVDRFGDYLTIQFTSLGIYQFKDVITESLVSLFHPKGIILRTEQDILAEEGLELKDGIIYGEIAQEAIIIKENGISFEVNLSTGQKTGFYLDQRANRAVIERYAKGKTVLDLCTYSGGFALHAAKAGAKEVTAVDVSANALELAEHNAALNNFNNFTFLKSDMFKYLAQCIENEVKFDIIVLDPPKMTHSKGSVNNALTGYVKLNIAALKCLNPHGILITCSCSGRISKTDFASVLHSSALAANRTLRILEVRGADSDHPISVHCPESEYLKCVVCYAE